MLKLQKDHFAKFTLANVKILSRTVKLLGIRPLSGDLIEALPVSYALRICNQDGSVCKPYTPINDVVDYHKPLKELQILVREYENGRVSGFLSKLRENDILNVKGPYEKTPNLQDTVNNYDEIGLIAGGTGITPMLQISRFVLRKCPEKRVSLLFGNKTDDEILLRDELNSLALEYAKRFTVEYETGPVMPWESVKSTINPKSLVFMCGPPGMMKYLGDMLGANGYEHVIKY